jgi:hypothetical protein
MRRLYFLVILLPALLMAACQQGQNPTPTASAQASKPNVVIVSPASNATFEVGAEVKVQSTSADAQGIVLVELSVDGQTVQNSPTPNGQPQAQFSVIQTWIPTTPGKFVLTVKATNSQLASGEASISVNIISRAALATATLVVQTQVIPTATRLVPTATPPASATPSAPTTCTLASTFVSDVTIPDGTVIAPGGAFVKTWAIQNSGTCTWGGGFNVLFVEGNPLGASSPQPIPAANPGDIINISVNMNAPTTPGSYTSVWQIQASNGVPFGARFDAVITVPGAPTAPPPVPPTNPPPPPPPVGCNGVPQFSSFIANPLTIAPGQISTLSWGLVSNANSVFLQSPSGTQPVGTPGSLQVQPSQTTTYTLTAYCNNVPAQLQVTVTVQGGGGGCNGTPFFNGFFANPQTISAGQQTTLNWGLVQNASAVFLEMPGKTEGVASPGSRNVKPASTTTYTLVAYCGNNRASVSTTVNVQGGCSGSPKFNGFTANPSTIQKGQSSTLSWGLVTNATSVVLQTPNGNSGVATPGNMPVSPKTTTTYTLIAYCKNTSAQLSVTVTVSNPPAPTPTPTPQQKTEIRNVSVERLERGKWRVTVQYFWNGESNPARIESVGTGQGGAITTNVAKTDIIAGFVKFVIQNLHTIGNGRTEKITACIVGRGNTELACKTVPAP